MTPHDVHEQQAQVLGAGTSMVLDAMRRPRLSPCAHCYREALSFDGERWNHEGECKPFFPHLPLRAPTGPEAMEEWDAMWDGDDGDPDYRWAKRWGSDIW